MRQSLPLLLLTLPLVLVLVALTFGCTDEPVTADQHDSQGDVGVDVANDVANDAGTDGEGDSTPDTCTCSASSVCCDGCNVLEVGAPCDDGTGCTEGERCQPDGTCGGGSSPCAALLGEPQCQIAECDDAAGCSVRLAREGFMCTADDPNGVEHRCVSGSCAPVCEVNACGTCGPAPAEVCDDLDNDCDGQIDEDVLRPYYLDQDGDGAGTAGPFRTACVAPEGYVFEPGDCDDSDPSISPLVPDACDDLDNNCDGIVDNAATSSISGSACPGGCPFGMVLVRDPSLPPGSDSWCIDRYEASRPDATGAVAGADDSRAVSHAGVLPWTGVTIDEALEACRGPVGSPRVRKRLCKQTELEFACAGVNMDTYPYGSTYDGQACNTVDAGRASAAPTGPTATEGDADFAMCFATRNETEIFDLSGNVAEFAIQNNMARLFGGSYLDAAVNATCTSSESNQVRYGSHIGFRCCYDP